MVRSMTGFGRAEASGESIAVTAEARSVNHRRVEVTVQLTPLGGAAAQRVQVDGALAREYVARARALAMELGLEGGPNLTWVLERPGVVRLEEPEPVEPAAPWPLLAEALGRALDELVARRTAEGERLVEALRTLHAELTTTVDVVAARGPAAGARREDRLRERLRALLAETAIDEARIVTEAAIWADKSDVTEELARLRAHLAEFTLLLDKGGPVGRPLDFLIQELNREVNTVASKADDLEMSQAALTAKGVLEKIREQVQNLE